MKENIYTYITPFVIFFILLEITAVLITKRKYIRFQEAIANFGTQLGNQTVNVLVMVGVHYFYGILHQYRFIDGLTMENPIHFIFLLLGIDFIFYWVHRWGHEINIMWAAHSPHHSAEEMNYMVALRASVTQRLFSFFFFWPLTIIGFKPEHIYAVTVIHLFVAFLHHTEFIPKLWRWVEFIFTTPSHHRVHHGVNFEYLDKNYGEFLIIWDRMFGSFAEEKRKVVYGMYNGPNTWNPIKINFHYFVELWKLASKSKLWYSRLIIWFMPLTWVPQDVEPKPPLEEITETNQVKLFTPMFPKSKPYLVLQVILGLMLMMLVISAKTPWSTIERIFGALILWHMIINWSGIMEKKNWVFVSEIIRVISMTAFVIWFTPLLQNPIYISLIVSIQTACLVWCFMYFRNTTPITIVKRE